MESVDFIHLSPVNDSEKDASNSWNSEPRETEIQQNSPRDGVNNLPISGCLRDCIGRVGVEYERHSQEAELDKVTEMDKQQIIQDCTEIADTDWVVEKIGVVQQSMVVENDCAVVDNFPSNECVRDCNSTVGVESEMHSQEVELDKVIEIGAQQIIQDFTGPTNTDSVAEKIDVVQQLVIENGHGVALDVNTSSNRVTDEHPVSGVKRARMTCIDQEPSIHVVYNSLTRESLKKLKELLQRWSEWHAQHETSDRAKDTLEYGEETYFPVLHVGQGGSSVSFWVDNQSRKAEIKESTAKDRDSVPLYDRGYVLGSNSADGSTNFDRLESLEASRCFNCGSYSHSLKECPRPRDNIAISSARKQHSAKKNPNAGSRGQSRYYLSSPGKFDDLKPGVLGPTTRECLGIGEFDPPPWLHRMREIGYPPGYLDIKEDEDQPSGITIFADEEIRLEREEGELPEGSEPISTEKKMSVEFPGINSPVPENANHRLWAGSSPHTPSLDTWKRHHHSSSSSMDAHRSYNQDQRRSREHGERGLHVPDNLQGSSTHGHSSRYSPYDHSPIPRSPTLERSHSDRGWRSPLGFEGSPGYGSQTHSRYSSRDSPYHHPSLTISDRWDPQSTYNGNPNSSSHGRDRDLYDHHYHHRR